MSASTEELRGRAIEAAERIAHAWTIGQVAVRTLHTTAWILSRANRHAPPPADRVDAALVEVTAAAAAGDPATVRALVTRGFERSLEEGSTLLQAIAAFGPNMAETALELALAHPNADLGGSLIAAALMRSAPQRAGELLARLQLAPSPLRLLEAVVEITIAGRDRNAPHARAEELWCELGASPAGESAVWWDGQLRMKSRESPENAADELVDATAFVGWRALAAGHFTLGRWARIDAEAAAHFVNAHAPRQGAWGRWMRGVTFDGTLPEAAREGWKTALLALAPDDVAIAGQMYAVAAQLGDLQRLEEVLAHVALPEGDRVDLAAVGLRMLASRAPERALSILDALQAKLTPVLHDELTVLIDVAHDVPWWSAFLPSLP